ncbi:MAG: alpha mannosidase-like protein [Thelocarpon impressellum]|nr:MAG: alpha mannosidase-like protein [Thelocarpon impressellum]
MLSTWVALVAAMSRDQVALLRQETVDMFYHGYDNYMNIAFPEDELQPVACAPLARDTEHPENIVLNDVLGNYSLTLIDSLSTLAILASSPSDYNGKAKAQRSFGEGVALLVEHYGDGSKGPAGEGIRARGFDVDSKVQVFETVIRGVGGLVSAHLFAIGELPSPGGRKDAVRTLWRDGFQYDGQLLRLAHDLASRLLPAFHTHTGLPYPRVNLRYGIPFYFNSPLWQDLEEGQCEATKTGSPEITETCSAGAGSLVLEFTTLSRLTGDARFEQLAKRAFWEVWSRRSGIGLIGAGIDAESGLWSGPITGIGAGIDSFFEYALKSHILLSGSGVPTAETQSEEESWQDDPNAFLRALTDEENSADAFLSTWRDAHFAIKRHLYRDVHHPHYINAHINTGSPQALWIDSLGAYYPGLLTLSGELDEAIETSLLYTALWTRYSALPERWSTRDGRVEGGLGWWPGRPEFIESNYHLYRATRDPWYLYVGEMVLRDIKRRCWTRCGWAGLQDVRTGELTDRMESFFLGETAKYLFLLFDEGHPLNSLDAPFVFTTEGHPLLIPRSARGRVRHEPGPGSARDDVCQAPPVSIPLSVSATAARRDVFHAASFTKLHLMPDRSNLESPLVEYAHDHPSINLGDLQSPTNYTFYPWTLPRNFIPSDGTSSKLGVRTTLDIQFPAVTPNILVGQQTLTQVAEGIAIHSLEGVRLGMVLEEGASNGGSAFRIYSIGNFALGRDEKVFIKREVLGNVADPYFARVRDAAMLDLVVDPREEGGSNGTDTSSQGDMSPDDVIHIPPDDLKLAQSMPDVLNSLLQQLSFGLRDASPAPPTPTDRAKDTRPYQRIPAAAATGTGAAAMPDGVEADEARGQEAAGLPWRRIYMGDEACTGKLPQEAASEHDVIVLQRGGCSFSRKLASIPSFAPSRRSVRLVVVVSFEARDGEVEIRPLLDEVQRTPGGLARREPLPMVLVGGGARTWRLLGGARAVGVRRQWVVRSQGTVVGNLIVV